MKLLLTASALGAATLAIAAPASAAIVFNSLSVSASTAATMSGTGGGSDADTTSMSYSAVPSDTFSVKSLAKNGKNSNANANTSVNITFLDASNFSFDSTSVTSLVFKNNATGTASAGKYNFTYNFTATTPWSYEADWDVKAPDSIQPALGPKFGSLQLLPTAFGTQSFGLLSAGTYTLVISADFQDLLNKTSSNGHIFAGSSADHFNFSITSVPEPETWALMIAGIGLVGFAMRRRKARVSFNFA